MPKKERRGAQRVEASLAITVSGGPEEAKGETLNISTNGVYFQSPYYIEPLTKVQLELMIPVRSGDGEKESPVACDGIVVRIEPEREDPSVSTYNVAVFFSYLPDTSQKKLEKYITQRLSS